MQMLVNNTHVHILIINFGIELKEFNKTILLLLENLPTSNKTSLDKQDWLTFVYKHSGIDNFTGDHRQLLLDNLTYPTYYFKGKHLFYNQTISNNSLEQLIHRLTLVDGQISMLFNPWDGYLSKIPVNKTAFPHRHFKFGIQFLSYWNDHQHEKKQMNLLKQIYLSIYNDSTKYSYINYIDRDEHNWMNVYYNTHQQRLINIKHIYDKKNRFYFEKTIQINQKKKQDTQIEDYGHRIPQDPVGNKRERQQILQGSAVNRQNWKQYSNRKCIGFFSSGFQSISCVLQQKPVGNHRKKS